MIHQPRDHRRTAFLLLCAGCIAAIVVYGLVTVRSHRSPSLAGAQAPAAPPEQPATAPVAKPPGGPKENSAPESTNAAALRPKAEIRPTLIYFRANALGENYGKAAAAPLNDLEHRRYAADLFCDRVHFSAGNGVCLYAERQMFVAYFAVGFDDQMRRRWSSPINGLPSRVRVSPSGKLAAITVFLIGQSYTSLSFATQTSILNAATGQIVVPDLEQFSVTRDGAEFKSKDFNFWGVTFAQDENRFYATLWSKGNTYLVEGDLVKRTAKVIHDTVECPSLSPDNTRIAFKKRAGGPRIAWRITVLDLKTGQETPLAENRSVDDQVEWLDNQHILYALSENEKGSSASTDIWVVPATANGTPQLLLKGGFSPALAR